LFAVRLGENRRKVEIDVVKSGYFFFTEIAGMKFATIRLKF